MRQVSPYLYQLESDPRSNIYLLEAEGGFTLVDSGTYHRSQEIADELGSAGYDLSDLQGILLTHGHGDHIGNAGGLAEHSRAPIMGHQGDRIFFEKSPPYPARSAFQGWLLRLADWVLFRQPPLKLDTYLKEGDVIQAHGRWEVLPTPGHTPGSLSFFQREAGILLCGDALFNQHPATGVRGLRLPLPLISVDLEGAKRSIRKIADLPVKTLCFGHGAPLRGDTTRKLLSLL